MTPTTDPPPTGSAWATYCPDAYPAAWYDALGLTKLPPGYARFATDDEAALITGRLSPDDFRARLGGRHRPGPPLTGSARRAQGGRFGLLNTFIDFELRSLPRSQVAVWLVLFRDARDGVARTSQADIARRCGLSVRGVQKAIVSLRAAGLVEVVRRGGLGAGSSTYRVTTPHAVTA